MGYYKEGVIWGLGWRVFGGFLCGFLLFDGGGRTGFGGWIKWWFMECSMGASVSRRFIGLALYSWPRWPRSWHYTPKFPPISAQ